LESEVPGVSFELIERQHSNLLKTVMIKVGRYTKIEAVYKKEVEENYFSLKDSQYYTIKMEQLTKDNLIKLLKTLNEIGEIK